MAMIHVNRGTTSLGVFSEQEIREGLSAGRFAPGDIGWREGMAGWQPLSQFPELAATAAPAVPPVQPGATPALFLSQKSFSRTRVGMPRDQHRKSYCRRNGENADRGEVCPRFAGRGTASGNS